jgi:Phasin protein
MRFAEQNLDASFAMANELTKAKNLKEALQIQSRHTQLQMHAFALQAQELGSLMNEAVQKAKLGS